MEVLRRPNGRLQACDPCRKRKLACDHTQPICNRCRKRKQGEEICVYSVGPGPSAYPPLTALGDHAPPQTVPLTAPEGPIPSAAKTGSGYLGFTSYCGVYDDTENNLHLLRGSGREPSQYTNVSRNSHDAGAPGSMSNRILEMCLAVLRNITNPVNPETLTLTGPSEMSWMYLVKRRVLASLHENYGQYFGTNCPPGHLEDFARTLCINTVRPLSDNEPDFDRWFSQFSGPNMRWESIGLLFTFWDFTGDSRHPRTGGSHTSRGKGFLALKESLRLCLDLCKEFSPGNSLMLYISQRCTIVESMSVGDANLSTWRLHAETAALLTFLGFHAPEEESTYQPNMSSEIKRRFFHYMYTMSMALVAFTGRPPLVSRRFISPPFPLDISDADLLSSNESFKKVVERLDENGWNTDGMIHSSTHLRARAMIASVREKIFEIALGSAQTVSVETLLELRARELQTRSGFPNVLTYNPQDLENPAVDTKILGSRLLIELDHLQNMFFIERLLLRQGREARGDLLAVSYEMLTLALPFWTHLDRLAPWRGDCEWLVYGVMAYGVPAGGILCLELLKPTLHNGPHREPIISRSSIIQKLSLLVGFLDWIGPSAPNGDLCVDSKSVIQRVLDQTLNAASSVYEAPTLFDWDTSTQLDFNFELLDTFDWNRPEFTLSNQSN
ncbi:hypothetical protein F4779DRAFT_629638 [Xylariaceae sp. FL0662B]|nr:hypothetical protein F4779DRAFT_629638 [Xylariaceae sp. FL0662B]